MIKALALVAAGAGYECWPGPRKLARQASQGVLATAPNRAVNWHPGMRASCQLTLSKLSPAGPSSDNRPTSANTPKHRIQHAAKCKQIQGVMQWPSCGNAYSEFTRAHNKNERHGKMESRRCPFASHYRPRAVCKHSH